METKMSCRLYVTVIIMYNFFVENTYAQNPMISKSINITSMIGETIEFDCLEYEESTNSKFDWFKNGKSLQKEENYYKFTLIGLGEILRITNITNKEEGTYECAAVKQFHSHYSIYILTVDEIPSRVSQRLASSNETINIGEKITWYCWTFNDDTKYIDQFIWFKNGEPVLVNESNERISFGDKNETLEISNIIYQDKGTYECLASNKFRVYSAVYELNVVEHPDTFYTCYNLNETRHVSESLTWSCDLVYEHIEKNYKYTWFKNGKPLRLSEYDTRFTISDNNYSLAIDDIMFEDAGYYRCEAFNGSVTGYINRTLIVVDKPKQLYYKWYTSNIKITTGVTLQLRCNTLFSTKKYTTWYSWKKNGKPLTFENVGENLTENKNTKSKEISVLFNNILDEKVVYECEAENYYHKLYSVYTLQIEDPKIPEIYNSTYSTILVCLGKSVELVCYARGMPTPTIIWLKNDSPIHISEYNGRLLLQEYKQKLVLRSVKLEDEGNYKCNVSNKLGSKIALFTISIRDKKTSNEGFFNLILNYLLFFSVLITGGIFTTYYVMSSRREQNLRKELEVNKQKFLNGDIEKWNDDLGIEEQTDLLPYDRQWEVPKNKIKLCKQLGSGAFGVVFKAEVIGINGKTNSTTVAVKMVKSNSDLCHIKALISELKIMIHIGKHLNIVNVLGACTEDISNGLMVIVEYCRYGSIREYLLKQRNSFINQVTPDGLLKYDKKTIFKFPSYQNYTNEINSLELSEDNNHQDESSENNVLLDEDEAAWCSNYYGDYSNESIPPLCTHDLICWSFQITRGMEYLSSKKVLHGDLAIRNILLADDNVVKICDFGLAKTLHNYDIYKMSNKVPLPVKWMAIESLRDQVFSTRSDVWSFGIVLWELFSLAEIPYPNVKSFNDLYDLLVSGYRMKQPKYANHLIYDIMYDCWKMDPDSRPSFTDLTERISNLLQDDSKSFYVNLNEEYIRINFNTEHSFVHYENVFSPIRQTTSVENSSIRPGNFNQSEINDHVEMKLMVHNQNYF